MQELRAFILHAGIAGLSLLRARYPYGGIGIHLDRLRVALGLDRDLRDIFQRIERLRISGFRIQEQERNDFVTGIDSLGIRTRLHTVTVGKLRRAVRKGFLGVRLKNLLVHANGFVRSEFAAVNFLDLALLDNLLGCDDIAGIDCIAEFFLGKSTCRKNRDCYGSHTLSE